MRKLETIAFLAREPGLLVLEDLLKHPHVRLTQVFTHRLTPKAEGVKLRPELEGYERACAAAGVKLTALDWPQAKDPEFYLEPKVPLDLVISLSWRFMIPVDSIGPRYGAINIHRGDLPRYKGAEPVRQALEAGEEYFGITAHWMTDAVDEGPALAKVWHRVQVKPAGSLHSAAEIIKRELYPLYAPLARLAIEAVLAAYEE